MSESFIIEGTFTRRGCRLPNPARKEAPVPAKTPIAGSTEEVIPEVPRLTRKASLYAYGELSRKLLELLADGGEHTIGELCERSRSNNCRRVLHSLAKWGRVEEGERRHTWRLREGWVREEGARRMPLDYREDILKLLADGEAWRFARILRGLRGASSSNTNKVLAKLVLAGEVKREGRGVYRIGRAGDAG